MLHGPSDPKRRCQAAASAADSWRTPLRWYPWTGAGRREMDDRVVARELVPRGSRPYCGQKVSRRAEGPVRDPVDGASIAQDDARVGLRIEDLLDLELHVEDCALRGALSELRGLTRKAPLEENARGFPR